MTSWRTDSLCACTRVSAPQRVTSKFALQTYIGTRIGLLLGNLVGYFLFKIGLTMSNPGEIPWGNIYQRNLYYSGRISLITTFYKVFLRKICLCKKSQKMGI